MLGKNIVHLGFDNSARTQAKKEIEKGNLFIGNTFEEYILIQKVNGKYHLGTYSIVSHDGINVELSKGQINDLFDTVLSEKGSGNFYYIDTHGDSNALKYRADIVAAILETKDPTIPRTRLELHLLN